MRPSKDKKTAKAKADRYFSEYIRKRDSVNGVAKCCTCGKIVSDFDCGHFISRKYEATRYDERNAHAQCLKCNRFESGHQYAHSKHIEAKYGPDVPELLYTKSRMLCKRRQADYEHIASEYKDKLSQIT